MIDTIKKSWDLLIQILSLFWRIISSLWNAMTPTTQKWIIGLFITSFILWIIKNIAYHFKYNISRIEGFTHRQSKKKAQNTVDTIDLISSVNDLHNTLKK